MKRQIIPDTVFVAITRDSEINTAGGIEQWASWILPHVEKAVIVDTGSVDKTPEILRRLKATYHQLETFSWVWESSGFVGARNFALDQARTENKKYVFTLDDDERIEEKDFPKMIDFMAKKPRDSYEFSFREVSPTGKIREAYVNKQRCRLFPLWGPVYTSYCNMGFGESLNIPWSDDALEMPIKITHFLPDKKALRRKREKWYDQGILDGANLLAVAQRDGWKEPNPQIYRDFSRKIRRKPQGATTTC